MYVMIGSGDFSAGCDGEHGGVPCAFVGRLDVVSILANKVSEGGAFVGVMGGGDATGKNVVRWVGEVSDGVG